MVDTLAEGGDLLADLHKTIPGWHTVYHRHAILELEDAASRASTVALVAQSPVAAILSPE